MTDKKQETIDEIIKQVNDKIDAVVAEAGYAIYGVGPGPETQSFTITLGRLQGSVDTGKKEYDFLMVGIEGGTSGNIFKQVIELGIDPSSTEPFELKDFPNIKFKFENVDLENEQTNYYLSALAKYQLRVGGDAALLIKQIIYSDDQGKFISDVGCKLSQVEAQYPRPNDGEW